jgi:hypothetical protein
MVAGDRLFGWRAGLVWLLALAGVAITTAAAGIGSFTQPDEPGLVAAAMVLLVASLGIVGTLTATRQHRNPIGWALWLSALALALGMAIDGYVTASLTLAGGQLPGTTSLAWLLGLLFTPVIGALLIVVPLLFPNGNLLTPRWRWVLGLAVVVGMATILPTMFGPGPLDGTDQIVNPLGIEAVGTLRGIFETTSGIGLAILLPLVLISLLLRYRRGAETERQQIKWFAAAVILTGSCFAVALLPTGPLPIDFWLAWILAIPFIPIAIGIAILRYRLYDIDRIISRTLSWALVTGLLVAAFVGLVIGLTALLGSLAGGSTFAVAGSTLVVFALFQPLRRRVQVAVDRRFDRARYDARRTADAFAERLRNDVDLASVQGDLLGVVHSSLQPASVAIWTRSQPGHIT